MKNTKDTDFGFERVSPAEKNRRVYDLFSSVSSKYDLMNDLMSGGLHRLWKISFISMIQAQKGANILDIASGSGDIALAAGRRYPHYGELTVSDINAEMLTLAKDKLMNAGLVRDVHFVQGNAEDLPVKDDYYDCALISFGLRNVTDKKKALSCILKKLRGGGKLLILEFSQVTEPQLKKLYDLYSFNVIPLLGELVAHDRKSYQYLVESIRMHPSQKELLAMMQDCGYVGCSYHNMNFGVVAIHCGIKP